jgi:hypothetical protein
MANILATVTEDARKYWPQFFGTLLGIDVTTVAGDWNPLIKFFRVGEGGWITDTNTPRTPQPDLRRIDSSTGSSWGGPLYLQDLDCVIDPQRAAPDRRYSDDGLGWYEKELDPGTDFIFTAPSTIQIRCLLDFSEFNDTFAQASPTVTNPNICELALFSDHPLINATYPSAAHNRANHADYIDPNFLPDNRLMIAYGTFPVEVKDSSKQIEHLVQIVF